MKRLLVSLLALSVMACGTSRDLMRQEEMESVRQELRAGACAIRMDSLSFEIDGLLYQASLNSDVVYLEDILPDTLPICPESGLEYVITENDDTYTVTCPSGHGSRTAPK